MFEIFDKHILFKDKLPEEWMLSSLVPVFKGNPLNPNYYRGIKLLEHAFKLFMVSDRHFSEVVDIDKMLYGFMPGRVTADNVCSAETY